MFNLLVKYSGWAERVDRMPIERLLEYTSDALENQVRRAGSIDFASLVSHPAVFVQETSGAASSHVVHVGTILKATAVGREVVVEYFWDSTIPSLTNEDLEDLANELGIASFEFSRTHWALKDADLFRALLKRSRPRQPRPRVFQIAEPERIEQELVSAMMPFAHEFSAVYEALQQAATEASLRCRRADDIWENPAVIQDVVSLIDRSRVVVADCTGRNPNVFYEVGIAHTLGREVILITQNDADIPFDLRHLRYVRYLNNGEGRATLVTAVSTKLRAIAGT